MIINTERGYATKSESFSLFCLNIIFGKISPKIMISTVIIAVETATNDALPPARLTATVVAIEDIAILTMLLPISKVVSVFSNLSQIFTASCATRLPSSASCLSLIRLTAVYAISVPEKNAEKKIRITISTVKL